MLPMPILLIRIFCDVPRTEEEEEDMSILVARLRVIFVICCVRVYGRDRFRPVTDDGEGCVCKLSPAQRFVGPICPGQQGLQREVSFEF